ncbi:MAG: transporter related [Deltaproteobacteria bacterium]|jgi:branched-chain amino acid transport system ATP-binding protein|nr:transporter related [Deltaproteobacteria bacterium]
MAERSGNGKAILELKDVYKDFDGLEVLFGINLDIRQGERHAIIGPNGAGKSTIFNLITGRYPVSKGKIFFKGEEVTGTSPYKLNRQGLSRSFQITNIFKTMTVFQNVRNAILSRNKIRFNLFSRLDRMEAINRQTEEVLKQIGLFDRKEIISGLLSYGEQRALEIGLTIATTPDLVLLDEPTAGMSTEETREAVKLIGKVTEGKTLIIVEHDMEVVFSLADRITVLYYGQVLASGPPEEIRNDQRVKDAYLGEEQKED